jgi:translation elongation factor EF-Tu-like GTPase
MKRELVMEINDAFFIIGKGVAVTGKIQNEGIFVGQKVIIDLEYLPEIETEIKGIELHRLGSVKNAIINENVAIIFTDIEERKVSALRQKKIYLF